MNKIILLGRLTKDIELRYTQNNKCVTNYSIAVNRRFKQEGQADVDFIKCVSWGKTAEFLSKYFCKGQRLALNGRLQVRKWEDETANTRYITEVVAEQVYFADSKKSSNNDTSISNNNDYPEISQEEAEDELPF